MSTEPKPTYLFNERKKRSSAHLWDGQDTACRMWSTGGMSNTKPGYVTASGLEGRLLCHMCQTVAEKASTGPLGGTG